MTGEYKSKAGSVTLTGTVDSPATRAQAATLASQVPNVKEVVNELQVKNQKATGGRGR
jgi:osmotically-inducible protein OsmY